MTRFSAIARIRTIITFVVLLNAGVALGQQVTGTILGRVTDSTGAVVPGATIQIQNPATGFSRTDTADADGRYLESNLPLGTYSVTVQKEGFQTFVHSGIVLTVGSELTVNAELVVGNVQQHVEVTGEAPQIETTNATVSGLVNPEQMRDLPLNGRSIDSLALLSPGVFADQYAGTTGPGYSSQGGGGIRISVDGTRVDDVLFLLDGTNVNGQHNGGPGSAAGVSLGVEGILEFRVLTHTFSAEYGRKAGAVISEVTRSGTNEFHGGAYEFVRNNFFDARNVFNYTSAGPYDLPPFRRNQFGADMGGPIIKDKLFFFVNYEGLRQRQGNTLTAFVPNACARQGVIGSTNYPTCSGGTATVTVSPAIVPYLALFPMPNSTDNGDGTADYTTSPSQPTREDYSMMRMDYKISDKDNFYWRYVFDPASTLAYNAIPGFPTSITTTNHFVTLSETHIFSQNSLNEFRFAFNRSDPHSVQQEPSASAYPGVAPFVPGQGLGGITFSSSGVILSTTLSTIGPTQGGTTFIGTQNLTQGNDTFSTVHGAHSLKFGVDVERVAMNIVSSTALNGFYSFGSLTGLLAATPTKFTVLLPNATDSVIRGWRLTDIGWFVQDDFRIRHNLTLNLGFRHEFYTSPTETSGRTALMVNFTDPAPTVEPNAFHERKDNFSPRIGLAWDPTGSGKTSVRAGGGIFYSFLEGRTWYFPSERNSQFSDSVSVSTSASLPVIPFPNAVANAFSGGGSPNTYTMLANPHVPTIIQYNLDIQRQLGRGWSLDVGYVGSVGYHLPLLAEENTYQATFVNGFPTFPTTVSQALRTNPNFADIFALLDVGRLSYNGLQATLQKTLSAGLQFQAAYSYGHSLSDGDEYTNAEVQGAAPSLLNRFNPLQDWSRSAFDMRQRMVLNGAYEIPWANHLNGTVAKKLLGGWSVNGIYTLTTGLPLDITTGIDRSNNGDSFTTDRPNLNSGFSTSPTNGVTAGCQGIAASQKLSTPQRWFDPCAFSLQTVGTFGNLGRNTVTGPRTNNFDSALVKDTTLTERTKLEFRLEAFNLFNHSQFGLPNNSIFNSSGLHSGNAGTISTTVGPNREMQLGLKLSF